jgi:hypothetical protein
MVLSGVAGLLLVGIGTAGARGLATHTDGSGTCTGGAVAPGTYSSLTISGMCAIPSGTVIVQHNLSIEQNAALDAHFDAATLIVRGNVRVQKNAVLLLGCLSSGCDTTNNRVNGNVVASGALALIFHHNTIGGNIVDRNGGGGVTCTPTNLFPFGVFSDFEDNTIGGNLIVGQLGSCWMGIIRDTVSGNVLVLHNVMADPDANEVTTNVIGGNLICFHNSPPAQFGDAAPIPNVVKGNKLGECAKL